MIDHHVASVIVRDVIVIVKADGIVTETKTVRKEATEIGRNVR